MRRVLTIATMCLMCVGQTETVQLFVPPGEYEFVVRECRIDHDDDDWGPLEDVIIHVEWYIGDLEVDAFEYACAQNMHAVIIYRDAPRADLDQDGDVDLEDFKWMQIRWTGPR